MLERDSEKGESLRKRFKRGKERKNEQFDGDQMAWPGRPGCQDGGTIVG